MKSTNTIKGNVSQDTEKCNTQCTEVWAASCQTDSANLRKKFNCDKI